MPNVSKRVIAVVLALAVPAGASAGPIREAIAPAAVGKTKDPDTIGPISAAIAKAGREIAAAQRTEGRARGRFWSSIALIAGGGALSTLSLFEVGDDETGPDDGEDADGSDDGEDSDGWSNKAMLGGGIAAAALGTVLLVTGGRKSGPEVAVKRGGFAVRHTVRF